MNSTIAISAALVSIAIIIAVAVMIYAILIYFDNDLEEKMRKYDRDTLEDYDPTSFRNKEN